MTDKYFTANVGGDTPLDVTKSGSASPTNFIDVRVTVDATGASKLEAVKALEAVRDSILQDTWPPA